MDFADDIAYSIFDLEDFYKAGKVPLERLSSGTDLFYSEVDSFMQGAFARWNDNGDPPDNEEAYVRAFLEICNFFPARPYSGTRVERAFLRDMTSVFVARYVGGIQMVSSPNKKQSSVAIAETHKREIRLLKELTWFYVINNPALATQQHGYRHVIEELFNAFLDAGLGGENLNLFPPGIKELLRDKPEKKIVVRVVVDFIAMMSEQQALEMYRRLKGIAIGSFFKTIV